MKALLLRWVRRQTDRPYRWERLDRVAGRLDHQVMLIQARGWAKAQASQ